MPKIFYSNKTSFLLKLILNLTAFQAWIMGTMKDTNRMKQRIKGGYEGAITNDVNRYDETATAHYTKVALELLDKVDLKGKTVLDVGCGTGIVSEHILKQGAKKLDSGDLSENMLNHWKKKASVLGYNHDQVGFHLIDAESLPFDDNTYDVVVSSMVMGLIPDQHKMVSEMKRVLRPGGTIAISTHGPEHYSEGLKAHTITFFKNICMDTMGYRSEVWHLDEKGIKKILARTGLNDIQIKRRTWQDDFGTPENTYDFYTATTGNWWYELFPPHKRDVFDRKARETFEKMNVTMMTQDVTFAYGVKPYQS